jgi:A/G-specific adenine glycosylase
MIINILKPKKAFFTKNLLFWHNQKNDRKMPWKGEKNAYKIWLSEIILQQTKVEQGLKYYENFVKKFPTIIDLANAKDEIVVKMWEGLGYYNRCRNLLYTARYICTELKGIFPTNYTELLKLKGVGKYTAAAIASFAYNLPYAVVDGNVHRVLSRFFAINTPIDSKIGVELFETLAQELLDNKNAGIYNQAIMDLGATVCKPKLAICSSCFLPKKCAAFQQNAVYDYPVKSKKNALKERNFVYFIFEKNNKILLQKRTEKDIWQDLYEFVPINWDAKRGLNSKNITTVLRNEYGLNEFEIHLFKKDYVQKLSHQKVTARFVKIYCFEEIVKHNAKWVDKKNVGKMAFAAIINDFLKSEKLF